MSIESAAGLPAETGTPDVGVAGVSRSYYQFIDGLLTGTKWAGGTISYSFPDDDYDYSIGGVSYPAGPLQGFSGLSAQQMTAVHHIMNASMWDYRTGHFGFTVEGLTNLNIDWGGTGTGYATMRFGNNTDAGTAYAYYPSTNATGGDVWFGPSGKSPVAGNYDYYTVMHEIGHALGLKHGHETGGYGALPFDTDSMEYSAMTYRSYVGSDAKFVYNEEWGYAQTFMMYDIAALQHMYGADFTTNAGNTVYRWSPTTGTTYVDGAVAIAPGGNRIFQTIWDGGGIDTYDLSAYSTNLSINLNPGYHSTFSQGQLAYLGGGPNNGYARGNVFNALQYNGDARSLIENVVGGSGDDDILGNNINNWLRGGAGDDDLTGFLGNDTLMGEEGDDWIDGHVGGDAMYGGGGSDTYYVDNIADTCTEYVQGTSGGTDLVFSSIHFVLGTGLDNLILISGANIGGDGNDLANAIDGGTGNNTLRGMAGNDILRGHQGADLLHGGLGNDQLFGGDQADELRGEAGADVLRGGAGADILIGGLGADLFDFDAVGELAPGARDVCRADGLVPAFEGIGVAGGDRIDLAGIDANATAGGNQAFGFGGIGIGRVSLANSGGNTLVRCNTDNDAAFELELLIEDGAVLAAAYRAGDFVL